MRPDLSAARSAIVVIDSPEVWRLRFRGRACRNKSRKVAGLASPPRRQATVSTLRYPPDNGLTRVLTRTHRRLPEDSPDELGAARV
jgi:hypothetical protein